MPPYDEDPKLMALQVAVAAARAKHEDLVRRRDIMRKGHYWASSVSLDVRAQAAANELRLADRALAAHVSKRQRGIKT